MRRRSISWTFVVGLFVGAFIIILYNSIYQHSQSIYQTCDTAKIEPIKCLIEGRRKLNCLKDESDVYLPFNKFIRKQFEVYGTLINSSNSRHFEYYTSYSKSKRPDIRNYNSTGVFGNFGSFNVEKRDRVKCISAINGLPMSNQWDTIPYFYPVQVAQFGLQHYSKLLIDPPPKVLKIGTESISSNSKINEDVILNGESDFVIVKLNNNIDLPIVKFDWLPFSRSSSFIFIVQDIETGRNITLNYVFSDEKECVWPSKILDNGSKQPFDFFYSLNFSTSTNYSTIIRDLNVDTLKALSTLNSSNQTKKDPLSLANAPMEQYRPLSLAFRGNSHIKLPIYQQSSAHEELFLSTSDWLLMNQALNGGFPVPVEREISGIKKVLHPGWLSAMGQGHCISVLVRAYSLTKDRRYIEAAENALRPFETEAIDGGVRNHFLGLPWYEEYPTQPPSLVLNGFIYAMIGLYDLSTMPIESATKAKHLFEAGLDSLRVLLPLYDTGRGSSYDLKHATTGIIPNLARPDYHKAHVYLLKWMHVITGDQMFQTFSNRWYEYSVGGHAKVNG